MVIIIWGVSGVGKTKVGTALAADLGWKFYDADDFHPAANIAKMHAGIPLDDDDRHGWLLTLRELIKKSLEDRENAVLACSALKKAYREILNVSDDVKFVLLWADYATIAKRLAGRTGHFMNPHLLKSQFDTLEMPTGNETVIDASLSPEDVVKEIERTVV